MQCSVNGGSALYMAIVLDLSLCADGVCVLQQRKRTLPWVPPRGVPCLSYRPSRSLISKILLHRTLPTVEFRALEQRIPIVYVPLVTCQPMKENNIHTPHQYT